MMKHKHYRKKIEHMKTALNVTESREVFKTIQREYNWGSTVVGQRPVLTDRLSWDYGKIK